ncbi:MAG TPA: phytanoyl-CoA dioxygenase family protein [Candidatus Methylacidiphilales bacterium]|jgi:ectoine hydroxylase-related dioxygenase (phytanoyl-CoA dioxygenase family)|nr:phytanoyl-CoA dioxygenase family protein [Candidatus Methylacidiphilales bacterium]
MNPEAFDTLDYLFDLRGYVILKQAIDPEHIAELNATFDSFPELPYMGWWGNVQRLDNNGVAGIELQNIVEAGEPFEKLIDNPAWFERLRRYCGEKNSYVDGLFIDECFASIRRTGGFFPIHSGGHEAVVRNQFRFINGKFRCGQVNILMALTDIGPGDGGTLVVPGSHKTSFVPDEVRNFYRDRQNYVNSKLPEGAVEVNLKAGDALMFVDAVMHGATERTNPGERRVVIYRYGPIWGRTRHGFEYSEELLARLTPERRKVLRPDPCRLPGTQFGVLH